MGLLSPHCLPQLLGLPTLSASIAWFAHSPDPPYLSDLLGLLCLCDLPSVSDLLNLPGLSFLPNLLGLFSHSFYSFIRTSSSHPSQQIQPVHVICSSCPISSPSQFIYFAWLSQSQSIHPFGLTYSTHLVRLTCPPY